MKRAISTLDYPLRAAWTARVDAIDRTSLSRLALLRRLVGAAPGYDAMVLDGAIGIQAASPDLAAAVLIARRRRRPALVLADCTWKSSASAPQQFARRAGIRLIDRAVARYCVLSSDERDRFGATWGVDPRKVVFTPFYFTLSDDELEGPVTHDGGIFAGGDSMRDFGPLIDASRGLAATVTLATGRADAVARPDVPGNVRVGRVPHGEFVALMRAATAIVVPLPPGATRSAGQQTYLNAMALGKIVVVTDSPGARDYVEHGRTGFIVPPGDAAALRATLEQILEPGSGAALDEMRQAARDTVRGRFTPDNYVASLLDVLDLALEGTARRVS